MLPVSAPLASPSALTEALARRPWIRTCVGAFLAGRVLLFLIGGLSRAFAELPFGPLEMWLQWDAAWYLSIAQDGYSASTAWEGPIEGQSNLAFFPLYPLLVRLFGALMPSPLAGVLLSSACLLGASLFLHRLAAPRLGERGADFAVLSLNAFPGSFVYSSVMTEGLFLLLTTACVYFATRRAYAGAAVMGGLASITRVTGILAGVAVGIDWVKSRLLFAEEEIDWRQLLAVCAIPLPLVGFMGYLLWKFGDAYAFQSIQPFWGRSYGNPFSILVFPFTHPAGPVDVFVSAYTIVVVLAVLAGARALTWGELFFFLASILLPLSSGTQSLPRYLVAQFPLHLAMGGLMARRPFLGQYLPVAMALFNGFMMTLWSRGHHVFV